MEMGIGDFNECLNQLDYYLVRGQSSDIHQSSVLLENIQTNAILLLSL